MRKVGYKEAVSLAELHGQWQPHPSRDNQHIAFVQSVEHLWAECHVPLNACVSRYWNRKKDVMDHISSWSLPIHDSKSPGSSATTKNVLRLSKDYEQMKSGGWALQKLSATRYSAIVFSMLTVVLGYSLSHLFSNTQAGSRFAETTRQALAFEQLRSRRTHVIVYVGDHFEIFETLHFAQFILQLPAVAQERLRHWLDEHLHTVQKQE